MELTLIRGLYGYHWWANRQLFDAAAAPDLIVYQRMTSGHG
jgi:uncharacterized damage-inducible protein DinB